MRSKSTDRQRMPYPIFGKRVWATALALFAAAIAGGWLPERIVVATTDSLDHHVFFKMEVETARIKEGDYLLFRIPCKYSQFVDSEKHKTDLLIKKVGCTPGEFLIRDSRGTFYCRQTALGTAKERGSGGETLPVFTFSGRIPKDSYFMVGTNPLSFDSRYFGFIHADKFIWKALPLW